MLQEYDTVRLIKPIRGKSIPLGAIGAVLIDHHSSPAAYEVEFMSEEGESLGVATVMGDSIEKTEPTRR